ncbi:MAG: protein kinase, partial [Oscillospiraceae bacterium]|nr:protein kinase [Oscillospiraceae bacterium]
MSEYKMCVKCLSHYEADKTACPFCGSENTNTNPTGALPLGAVLGGAYTVGEFREIDGEGVIYTGVDNARKRRVMIKEFMPVTLCAGRHTDGAVKPKEGSEVLFKTAMMDFSEVYTTLINMGAQAALAQVYDLISANGTAYAVTEYPEGEKLEDYLAHYEGALDWRDAMVMLEPVCIAVEKLHRLGWIHRGISPENITVSASGEAKLSGYATMALRTAHSEFKPQQYPGYTAPEQYSVREYQGAYTDIYALGAVLYRTITGETPPPARERQRQDELIPAGELVKTPKFISAALTRALRLDSAGRFQTVLELREALADAGRPAAAPSGPSKMKKLIGENRVAVYIIAGVVGMIAVIALLWLLIRSTLPAPKDDSSLLESSSIASSESMDESQSSSAQSSSVMEYITLPSFVGKKYTDVQT